MFSTRKRETMKPLFSTKGRNTTSETEERKIERMVYQPSSSPSFQFLLNHPKQIVEAKVKVDGCRAITITITIIK